MVYLKKRKVLFGGDVILNKTSPILMANASGDGYIEALADCARLEVKTVVPGHGAIGGPEVITDFLWFFEDAKMAAMEPAKKKEVEEKYKDWRSIPFVMSTGATIHPQTRLERCRRPWQGKHKAPLSAGLARIDWRLRRASLAPHWMRL